MRILVPTDFSESSENGINASILLARKFDADIQFLHCIELPRIWNWTPEHRALINDIEELLRIQAEGKFESYKELLIDHNITCDYTVSMNDYLEVMEQEDTMAITDIVVIGAHGNKDKRPTWLGSHTKKVLRHINKNTLIVKNDIPNVNFEKVVYVTGLNVNEQKDFKSFLEFIAPFSVKEVHILCIDTFSYFTQPTVVMEEALKDYKALVDGYEVYTNFYKDYSVNSGVKHYVEQHNIDLIGISNSHKHPIKRIFSGSNVELVATDSDIPVLAIA